MIKKMINTKNKLILLTVILALFFVIGCESHKHYFSLNRDDAREFSRLNNSLEEETVFEKKFIIMRQILDLINGKISNQKLNLYLTTYVEQNPDDPFNGYYLMIVARNYRDELAYPFAIHYYERILKNYQDLLVKEQSIHYLCLKDLINLVDDPEVRIVYYKDLIARFSDDINIGETYYYLGNTYADTGEWEQAIQAYVKFLDYPDVSIPGDSFARDRISGLIAFYNTEKTWTVETLDKLVENIKGAINRGKYIRNGSYLKKYMASVNFFAVSWEEQQSTPDPDFISSIGSFLSPKIRVSEELDKASNSQEAYLKTTGWSYRISTWYLYFRKIDFPADSEIHGSWEWAGIYFGDKTFADSDEA